MPTNCWCSARKRSQASGLPHRGGVGTSRHLIRGAKKAQQHAAWWREGVRHTLAGVVLAFAIVLIRPGIAIRTKQQLLPWAWPAPCGAWATSSSRKACSSSSVASRQGLWFCLLIPAMTMLALYMRLMQGAQPSWRCALWFIPSALSPCAFGSCPMPWSRPMPPWVLAGMSGYLAWEALRWSRLLGQQPRDFSHNLIRLALVTSRSSRWRPPMWRNSAQPESSWTWPADHPLADGRAGPSVMRQLSDEVLHAQHEQARAELLVNWRKRRAAGAQLEHLAAYRAEAPGEVEQKRKRIASDLHDDLGAKLLTIVHTSQHEDIARWRGRH